MIAFIAGMPRSGSTFAFNVARDVLRARGHLLQKNSPNVLSELERAGNADHVLLKAHEIDEGGLCLARYGAMRLICTVRRPEDAVASWMELLGVSEEESIDVMRRWLLLYRQIRPFALTVNYGLIDEHPFRAAWRISRFLYPNAGVVEILQSAKRHAKAGVKKRTDALPREGDHIEDIGLTWYDTNTFFHRRHVSSLRSRPAEERMPAEQVARIRAALTDDIAAAGLSSGSKVSITLRTARVEMRNNGDIKGGDK
jgi:hypothetical protein